LQSDLLRKTIPVDSVALIWALYDLQVIDLNSNDNRLDERSMQKILAFAVRKKHNRLLKDEIALIRTHYTEADRIDLLHDLYYRQFPDELVKMATENPGLFYKLMASFFEEEKTPDSALFYFNKAQEKLRDNPNKILRANFYNRFGQFFLRQGQTDKAIEKFTKSYELASQAAYFDYMLSLSRKLEVLYAGKNDFRSAYHYAVLNKALSDSMSNMSKKDQFLIMEIDHENRQRDLAAEQEKQLTLRRHYLQYNAIIIIIITVFIVLLMLGSLKVSEWIIKMLGFFSFIFLFEFIVLIADHKIHEITGGEPWKILLIKIVLIGMLLPFHHWIEKRVVAFLLNPDLINISRYPIRSKLREHFSRQKKN
jgi:tetratricopeptide (TPR) repeat protein